jgi:hypothetical protein
MVLMGYSGAWGTLIYEKNFKSKISCQTPFKFFDVDLESRIQDGDSSDPGSGMEKSWIRDPGSRINIPDPQHWVKGI